ncbi:MAG TPA: GNAT family N-acetyltransferase [Panacibacter sp.]|nr:GNAT family N-acetyltransferase [Panacibacter sp.]
MTKIFLRPWQREDAASLVAVANNRNVWNNVRDHLPHPYTLSDARQWIAHCKEQEPPVSFAIIYDGKVAGSIGCVPQKDVYRRTIEIGYFIGEQFWGKGIATESVRILLDYIETRFDVVRIYAEVFSFNKASMKVLQKNGFYLESIRRKAAIKNDQIIDDYVWVKLLSN